MGAFQLGDVVQLKSGNGPAMVVDKIILLPAPPDPNAKPNEKPVVRDPILNVECMWFAGDTVKEKRFPAHVLMTASTPERTMASEPTKLPEGNHKREKQIA